MSNWATALADSKVMSAGIFGFVLTGAGGGIRDLLINEVQVF